VVPGTGCSGELLLHHQGSVEPADGPTAQDLAQDLEGIGPTCLGGAIGRGLVASPPGWFPHLLAGQHDAPRSLVRRLADTFARRNRAPGNGPVVFLRERLQLFEADITR